jgi:nuclear transport factor 2 (NTF2) superfamily protein
MKLLIPPFTEISAHAKVQRAENLWNTRNPEEIVFDNTKDCIWRYRNEFIQGREAIKEFLTRKWKREVGYKVKKELFLFSDNKISVRFSYDWHDEYGHELRSFGISHWEFASDGRMKERSTSINDVVLKTEMTH